MKLNTLTLRSALSGLAAHQFSAAELQAACLAELEAHNPDLNAYLAHRSEPVSEALAGDLAGIPVAVKDNFLTTDLVTTASSRVLENYHPVYESTVTAKLRDAGAVILGKTNLDAWAHGSSTETSDFGPTKNPRNPEFSPGGSSGGTAAALAADMTIAGIGSETSGSIRGPSAWCGVVGLKPTYGRVSRAGVVAMGSSLDCPGPMTKTVWDTAKMLEVIAGQDRYDGTSSPAAVPRYTQNLQSGARPLAGKKVGAIYFDIIEDAAVRAQYERALDELRALGADVRPATTMDPRYGIGMYTVIMRSEVSSNLARYDGIRYGNDRTTFGAEAKRRIMLGTYTLSKGYADKYYLTAQKVRTKYIEDFARLFTEFDLLVAPTMPGYAIKAGESHLYPFFGEMIDMLAEPACAAGLPGITVPCYTHPETNLSLGLHILGRQFAEADILEAAYAYEQSTDWNPWVRHERAEGGV